jgi:signal peptidase II
MRKLLFTLTALLGFGFAASAQFQCLPGYGVEVEVVEIHDHAPGTPLATLNGQVTYRIYATTVNATDRVSAVAGGDNAGNPILVATTTSFYQDALGGLIAGNINPAIFAPFPTALYDSWVTIGRAPGDAGGEVFAVIPPVFDWTFPEGEQRENCAIAWYILGLIKTGAHKGFITSVALILAGAFGNIIDSAVYGLLFGRSTYTQVAGFMPADGGYAGFLKGFVVDMFHFTVKWPDWVPYFGGTGAEIFPPIFNVADAAITVGVIWILIRQRAYFPKEEKAVAEAASDES